MTLISDPRALTTTHDWLEQPPFITTHRARAVSTRQRSLLFAAVARRVKVLHQNGSTEAAVVRTSPDRYIAQVGPVALTVAWLRSRLDGVADSELLVNVWRGTVAELRVSDVQRVGKRPKRTATSVWEDVVYVAAESEASWRWCPVSYDPAGFTSEEMAERCVDRLRDAYADARAG
jgi:hypothetical protein